MSSRSHYEGQFDGSILLPTSSPVPLLQPPGKEDGKPQSCWKSPTFDAIISSPRWNIVLIISCVIAVTVDPLFFYIPFLSDDRKCIGRDRHVQTVALIFRSITDIGYLAHIVYQLHVAIKFGLSMIPEDEVTSYDSINRKKMGQFITAFSHKLSWRSFITDVLSILPLPQVLIVGSFFKIGGNHYRMKRKFVSGAVLMQFVPRTYRIYLSCSSIDITESGLRFRAVFNLFLYILASHVLGAFWYFFAIHREISCWYQNCTPDNSESKCTFYCHDDDTVDALITKPFNTTLNEQCLLKVPYNVTDPPFDFGIFFDLLKNDQQGKIKFPGKITYCFWWGLRNLSNFGTSLETSTYPFENIFAIVISIIGLLLFLYLIGNIQIFMERATTRKDAVREKIRNKKNDIDEWLKVLEVGEYMKDEIMKNIRKKLKEDINADLEDLYSLLPDYLKKTVMRIIGMKTLKNVPIINNADTHAKVKKLMCDFMKLLANIVHILEFNNCNINSHNLNIK